MSEKIKTAVIGLGVGLFHCKGYQANPDAELIAICDIDPARLRERGEELGIPEEMRFTDYHDLLKLPELDAVSVALPNHLHAPVTLDAFRAGKDVLCEKAAGNLGERGGGDGPRGEGQRACADGVLQLPLPR